MDRATLSRRLPGPVKWVGSAAMNAVDPLTVARVRRRHGFDEPIPPRRLRAHVGQPGAAFFVDGGRRVASELASVLDAVERPLTGFRSIYELGCGSGRVLSRLPQDGAALAGSDVDTAAISWLRRNHPRIDARRNAPLPPAPFEDRSFDLVYVISVFTHISESSQDEWLGEIARVLRPGGTAVMTVTEQETFERYRAGWRPGVTTQQLDEMRGMDLAASGIVSIPERITRWSRWRYPGVEASYGLSFHDAGYVREHWSRWFDVLDLQTGVINFGQSAVVCAAKA